MFFFSKSQGLSLQKIFFMSSIPVSLFFLCDSVSQVGGIITPYFCLVYVLFGHLMLFCVVEVEKLQYYLKNWFLV